MQRKKFFYICDTCNFMQYQSLICWHVASSTLQRKKFSQCLVHPYICSSLLRLHMLLATFPYNCSKCNLHNHVFGNYSKCPCNLFFYTWSSRSLFWNKFSNKHWWSEEGNPELGPDKKWDIGFLGDILKSLIGKGTSTSKNLTIYLS